MSQDIKLQISGDKKALANNGIYTFSNLKIVAIPDYSSQIKYLSSAVDIQKILMVTRQATY
jgi:hypothetical protein